MNILLTGIGCPGTAGTVCSIKTHFDNDYKIIGIDSNPNITSEICSPQTCDKFYLVPNAKSEQSYMEFIQHICNSEKIDLIIPQTTIENEIYSKYYSMIHCSIAAKILVQDYTTFCNLNNKLLLYISLRGINKNIVPTAYAAMDTVTLFDYAEKMASNKFVIKPVESNGSRGLRIIDKDKNSIRDYFKNKINNTLSKEEFYALFDSSKNVVLRTPLLIIEYLPGDEYSVDCFRRDSEFKRIVMRKRIEIKNGITWISEVVYEPELERICDELLEEYDIKGVVGFQFKKDNEGNFKILECNPRIQGSMIASTLAGCNIIGLGIDYILGKNIPEDYPTPEIGHKMFRMWGWI
jgi:carbamoyl-phosphate synthase large subunit